MNNVEEIRRQANLRLLQRTCALSSRAELVVSATHCVLYDYQQSAGQWCKSGIEGSLFVVHDEVEITDDDDDDDDDMNGDDMDNDDNKRRHRRRYQLIILNRSSSDNFILAVTDKLQLQHHEPYLIFKQPSLLGGASGAGAGDATAAVRVRGLWFHNPDERVQVYQLLQQTVDQLKQLKHQQQQQQQQKPQLLPADQPQPGTAPHTAAAIAPSDPVSTPWVNDVHERSDSSHPMYHHQQHQQLQHQPVIQLPRPASVPHEQYNNMNPSEAAVAAAAVLVNTLHLNAADAAATTTTTGVTTTMNNSSLPSSSSQQQQRSSSASTVSSNTSSSMREPSSTSPVPAPPGSVALDKKSLQLALLSLIQDDRFLDLLHSQYLRVVHSRKKKQPSPTPQQQQQPPPPPPHQHHHYGGGGSSHHHPNNNNNSSTTNNTTNHT